MARAALIAVKVYPRVCGGTCRSVTVRRRAHGLSPRVRGNPLRPPVRRGAVGSIPACAGEPARQRCQYDGESVYPRVCGGTAGGMLRRSGTEGLSPRVRGNRLLRSPTAYDLRSIPACAGEPPRASQPPRRARVYPRVCGGTPFSKLSRPLAIGLSPRVRGNQLHAGAGLAGDGSIPACAGEPTIHLEPVTLHRVYPRVCGGTAKR